MGSPYRTHARATLTAAPREAPPRLADGLLAALGAGMIVADAVGRAFGVATVAGFVAVVLALASLRSGADP
jgi:hypothetical protein